MQMSQLLKSSPSSRSRTRAQDEDDWVHASSVCGGASYREESTFRASSDPRCLLEDSHGGTEDGYVREVPEVAYAAEARSETGG